MNELNTIEIENICNNENLKKAYIEDIPKKLLKINILKQQTAELKKLENELKAEVEALGEYENDYFKIEEKISKSTKVDYKQLEQAIEEIKKEMPTTEEQQTAFKELQEQFKRDIEVKKGSEKIKLLKLINPAKAEQVKVITETKKLTLTEKKSLIEDLKDQMDESKEKVIN